MQTIENIYNFFPREVWIALFALLGATVVSFITQIVKKVLEIENKRAIQAVMGTIAFLASAMQYLLSNNSMPPTVLGVRTATLMGLATPAYLFVVKPLNNFIINYKAFKLRHLEDLQKIVPTLTITDTDNNKTVVENAEKINLTETTTSLEQTVEKASHELEV